MTVDRHQMVCPHGGMAKSPNRADNVRAGCQCRRESGDTRDFGFAWGEPEVDSNLARLAREATDAKIALDAAIVAERNKGRTLESIAQECGMTRAGVLYVVRKAER